MQRAIVAATSGVFGCRSILPRLLSDREYRTTYAIQRLSVTLALQFRALRDQRGWSQRELAQKANVSLATISRLESIDIKRVTINTLLRIAKAFDVALLTQFADWPEFVWNSDPEVARQRIDAFPDWYAALTPPPSGQEM